MHEFFAIPELWHIVGTSVLCGGIIGLERQIKGKPAGMRTSMLICLGTAIFVYLGSQFSGGSVDATRVLGQVVTGIGFLGAGVMIMREGVVLGVTTAAVIWVMAGIGASIGIGEYKIAINLSLATLAILLGTELAEKTFAAMRRGVHGAYYAQRGDRAAPSDKEE